MITSQVFTVHDPLGVCVLTIPAFDATGLVYAGFSTRMGGVSKGRYATMNLSPANGDDPAAVQENYRRLFRALGSDHANRLVLSHQTHTDHIRLVTESDAGKGFHIPRDYENVDGLMTNRPGLPLVTMYADCVPLLFLDPVRKAVASVHSGWRGTVQQIGRKAVEQMRRHFGSDPKDLLAAILPCIGPCCYQVDAPLYEAFSKVPCLNTEEILTPVPGDPSHFMLDLPRANREILLDAGITPDHLTVTDLCTHCHANVFHSHRATGGMRGNLAAVIELR